MNIVFLDRSTFAPEVRFPTDTVGDCRWQDHPFTHADDVVTRVRDADIVLSNKIRITAEHLASLPRLRLIAATATGVDHVDVDAARARGIGVCNVRGYAVRTVPEHVFALMLALRRSLVAYREDVRAGRWSQSDIYCLLTQPIRDLAGSTLGIIGGGSLGEAVARLGRAFEMRVLFAERRGATTVRQGRTPFDQVLAESDVISLHLPLTPETRHLIGAPELACMKPGAILINTARGALVDAVALVESLQRGHLGGAGIDVLDVEPPPPNHPLLQANLPSLIVTPHVAWASFEAQQRLANEVMANVAAFVRGESRNRVV
ncbi:MAG: D-2-hydroxyacid dehydrogenase [Pseudomonadota bacterium]